MEKVVVYLPEYIFPGCYLMKNPYENSSKINAFVLKDDVEPCSVIGELISHVVVYIPNTRNFGLYPKEIVGKIKDKDSDSLIEPSSATESQTSKERILPIVNENTNLDNNEIEIYCKNQ